MEKRQYPVASTDPAERARPDAVERRHHLEPEIVLRRGELQEDIAVGDLRREASGGIEHAGKTERKDVAALLAAAGWP